MSANKILFAVPTLSSITPYTCFSIAQVCQREDITYMAIEGSPTDQVRNQIVKRLLANPDHSHLMMWDSDIKTPDDIVDLLLGCNAPMAAGIVPIMIKDKIVSNIVIKNPDDPEQLVFMEQWSSKAVPFEAENVGTGCVLIHREVFETVPWPWFRYQEREEDGRRTGEDIFFGRKAAEYGYKYMVHPRAICNHYKRVDLLKIIEAWKRPAPVTVDSIERTKDNGKDNRHFEKRHAV